LLARKLFKTVIQYEVMLHVGEWLSKDQGLSMSGTFPPQFHAEGKMMPCWLEVRSAAANGQFCRR